MTQIGMDININYKSVQYGIFQEKPISRILLADYLHCHNKTLENKVCGSNDSKINIKWKCFQTNKYWSKETEDIGHINKKIHTLASFEFIKC